MHGGRWFFRPVGHQRDVGADEQSSNRGQESNSNGSQEEIGIEEIIDEYRIQALSIGIKLQEFEHLNPKKLGYYAEAYKQKEESELHKQNMLAHLQGQYFAEAIMCTVCNALSGKSGKKYEYPKKPYKLNTDIQNEMDEKEMQKQRELFVAGLMAMQANFELNHENKGDDK